MAYLWAILALHCSRVLAQSLGSAPAMAPALGAETTPTVVIQSKKPLPLLPVLQDSYKLYIGIARIIGPGHKGASDHPYVEYTGRSYNGHLTAGTVRGMHGRVHKYAQMYIKCSWLHHHCFFRASRPTYPAQHQCPFRSWQCRRAWK